MSLKVMQALHTLLGAHIQKKPANRGSIQGTEASSQPVQVQGTPTMPLDNLPQGGQYNPGHIPLQDNNPPQLYQNPQFGSYNNPQQSFVNGQNAPTRAKKTRLY